jgi:hypothetical protein
MLVGLSIIVGGLVMIASSYYASVSAELDLVRIME